MFPKPEKKATEKGGDSDAHQKRNPIHRRNQGMQKRKGPNAVYQKMQDMLKEEGFDNYYVGTVEATPSCEDVIAQVKEGSYKKVVLEPLMIVAGDHANNDMAGDDDDSWKSQFKAAGYEVTCLVRGLGELEPIQQLFVQHAQAAVGSLAK